MTTLKISDYKNEFKRLGLDAEIISVAPDDTPVTGLTFDSRQVTPGALFVCKGNGFKQAYLDSAIEKGAVAYVRGNDIRRAMAVLANMFYDNPWKDFTLVGLTGTKGKSTILYFLKSIMQATPGVGKEGFGFLSTIDTFDGINFFESHLTTPEAIELAMRFDNMRRSGIKCACMEVSSQGLKYDRTWGIGFDIAVFTNFGPDHIGSTEHPDIEDYFASKLKIFDQAKIAVINRATDRFEEVYAAAQKCGQVILYEPSDAYGYKLSVPGDFNYENAAAAITVARLLGASEEAIRYGLANTSVPGRMEVFTKGKVVAIADYAHNTLSFEQLFKAVKKDYPGWRIEAIFGCPGGKGMSRRVDLPIVTAKYADFVWVTEEDPADDDPMEISKEVLANLESFGGRGAIVIDREKAISDALDNAPDNTVVLAIAKGREEYQHRGSEYVKVKSDAQIIEEWLLR